MDKFLILLFVVAKVSSASAQCIESQNTSEIFTVDYEGLNFTIAFTVPDQCPALQFITAKVQQGNQSKEYCHFRNDPQRRQCTSSNLSPECNCDPLHARYVIKASLSEADDEGQEWIITGTDKAGSPVFNTRVHVALPRASVTSASVPLHTQTSQFSTEDTFSSAQNPVTEQSAQFFTTLDPNIIMYAIMGGILLLVLVVVVAFGIKLYRKGSADSSLGGWPESEFDMDPYSNTPDTAAATGGATPDHLNKEHDYENEQKELAHGIGDTAAYENDSIALAYKIVYANEMSNRSLNSSSKKFVSLVVNHCTPPSDPPVD